MGDVELAPGVADLHVFGDDLAGHDVILDDLSILFSPNVDKQVNVGWRHHALRLLAHEPKAEAGSVCLDLNGECLGAGLIGNKNVRADSAA